MRQLKYKVMFRRGALCPLPLGLLLGIALTFGMNTWMATEAVALTVSPTALTFQAAQGGTNPPSQSVTVSKSNKRDSTWTASDSASWVAVSPVVGSIAGSAQVAVNVDIARLPAGTYSATVTVTVYKGGSVSVPVMLTVTPSTTPSLSSSTISAATATLTWDSSTDTNVAGYNVYMGTTSGVYGPPIHVGTVTSYSVSNLAVGTYYFVVTDYDTGGLESLPSNEVSKSIY
jgi:hypothetical protein